jgi:hypothetical protein
MQRRFSGTNGFVLNEEDDSIGLSGELVNGGEGAETRKCRTQRLSGRTIEGRYGRSTTS